MRDGCKNQFEMVSTGRVCEECKQKSIVRNNIATKIRHKNYKFTPQALMKRNQYRQIPRGLLMTKSEAYRMYLYLLDGMKKNGLPVIQSKPDKWFKKH